MKSLYILLIAIAVSMVSCQTKDGAPGPAGEGDLPQQGKISGTLTYVDRQGNPLSIPFDYSYYETLSDNRFYYDNLKGGYSLNFFRRDLKDYNNYIYFENLNGSGSNGVFTAPINGNFEFSLVKVMGTDLFEFNGYFNASNPNSSYAITNFTFDPTTGRAFYDFELTIDPTSIDSDVRYDNTEYATVKGRVDVTLNRTQTYSSPQTPALN